MRPTVPSPVPPTPWWREGRVWLLLVITAATLWAGWMVKQQCHGIAWDGGEWRGYCYSDQQALYGTRGAADGTWPYVETLNEYPPLTGLFMHAVGAATDSLVAYLRLGALLLGALALVTTVLLAELVGRDRRILYWAAAPALALYAFYNWDLLAVAPSVGALLAFRRGRPGLAGALLGIGACAKLYPAFLAPALGLWILRADGGLRARGWRFGVGFAAPWLAVHVPLALLDLGLLIDGYRFQAGRGPNLESVWFAVGHLGREWGWDALDRVAQADVAGWVSMAALAAALGASGWAAWTGRLGPVAAACLPVLAFLATNKVYSVQYTLWAIPLLVVVPASRTLKALLVVADLAVFSTLSTYFLFDDRLVDSHLFNAVAFAVLLRAGVFAALSAGLVRRALASQALEPLPAAGSARPPPAPPLHGPAP